METGFLPRPTYDYPDIQDILSDLIDEGFEYGGETPVYKREFFRPRFRLQGPAIIEQLDTTIVIEPYNLVEVDASGNLLISIQF